MKRTRSKLRLQVAPGTSITLYETVLLYCMQRKIWFTLPRTNLPVIIHENWLLTIKIQTQGIPIPCTPLIYLFL